MKFTQEGPEDGQNKIIALELAVTDEHGREHELEMLTATLCGC